MLICTIRHQKNNLAQVAERHIIINHFLLIANTNHFLLSLHLYKKI
ncbi:hypothetical protein JIP1600_1900002 [Flavobacterium psychrophilum]|nr:hypothetical protein JIP1600_1900002 [Flavobacterium psychrophilum]